MSALPRITVVTPSFNQAAFLEQTIQSVIGQCYPNLEYLVFDGGSTDGSVEIIKKYEDQITFWQSGKDAGQAAAINAGFARSTGDILCWVNSDDFFFPGTLHQIARHLDFRGPSLVYGHCLFFWEGTGGCRIAEPPAFDSGLLEIWDFIVQPSTFWSRALWEITGPLREDLHFAFDWDWWLRARAQGRLEKLPALLSAYRFHSAHKSGQQDGLRKQEISRVFDEHAGPASLDLARIARTKHAAIRRYESLQSRLATLLPRASSSVARAMTPGLWDFSGDLDHLCLCAKVANP
jgi:glycosyltransferase involved in cell wall biosynthesis